MGVLTGEIYPIILYGVLLQQERHAPDEGTTPFDLFRWAFRSLLQSGVRRRARTADVAGLCGVGDGARPYPPISLSWQEDSTTRRALCVGERLADRGGPGGSVLYSGSGCGVVRHLHEGALELGDRGGLLRGILVRVRAQRRGRVAVRRRSLEGRRPRCIFGVQIRPTADRRVKLRQHMLADFLFRLSFLRLRSGQT